MLIAHVLWLMKPEISKFNQFNLLNSANYFVYLTFQHPVDTLLTEIEYKAQAKIQDITEHNRT